MTAPLAHTAIGANPSASTTGRIQRGGRPVATTNCAPAATAASIASRVRGVMVSFSSNNVPSPSQAMSAGKVIETIRPVQWSVQSALALPRSRHPVATVPLNPLLQFRQTDRPGLILARRTATQPPRHPELAVGVRILLLHAVEQLI